MAALAWGQPAPAVDGTAGVSGTVVNGKGAGVAATVRLTGLGSARPFGTVQSGADGAFSFTGLAAGAYRICATPSGSQYVDSCLWTGGRPVRITTGKVVTGYKALVETAGTLQVQIADPVGVLTAVSAPGPAGTIGQGSMSAKTAAPSVLVGVTTDRGLFIGARISASAGNVKTHSVTVPVDREVSLTVTGVGVTVAASAAPSKNVIGTSIPATISSVSSNAPIAFTVKGASN